MTKLAIATFGGGCFWCLEAVFQELAGVIHVSSGYSGGAVENPTYEQVCTGATGHAEVVQIQFDPETISYAQLLQVFFVIHDPTTLNRQGDDVGTQYRSVIFYHDPEQQRVATECMAEYQKLWDNPIVTKLESFEVFFTAEDYHTDYFNQNSDQGYCRLVIAPKVAHFRQLFIDQLRK